MLRSPQQASTCTSSKLPLSCRLGARGACRGARRGALMLVCALRGPPPPPRAEPRTVRPIAAGGEPRRPPRRVGAPGSLRQSAPAAPKRRLDLKTGRRAR